MGKPKSERPKSSRKPQKSGKHKKMKPTFETGRLVLPGKKKERFQDLEPKNFQDQKIPKKVKEIMRIQTQLKSRKDKKHPKSATDFNQETFKVQRGMSIPMKPAPQFVQGKKESDTRFMKRVDDEARHVIMTAQMEEKYKIDLSGDVASKEVPKKKKSEKKREKDKTRKKKKIQGVKEKKLGKKGDFSQFKDEVVFGEVAMQPPTLTAKPRKAVVDEQAKPGKRSLLLKQMMDNGAPKVQPSHAENQLLNSHKHVANRKVGETVKRKYLSPAQKRITDTERLKAIEMYRKLKDEKLKQT